MKTRLLGRQRYTCVWLKKVPSQTLIYNPEYASHMFDLVGAWMHQLKFDRNKQNFAEIMTHLEAGFGQRIEDHHLNSSFISCLPEKVTLSLEDYQEFLSDKTPFYVERFYHPDSVHLGSSRHVCMGPVQIKGVGRNMLVSRVDFIHAWGGATKLEGVYSYLASNLLNRQFPRGASVSFRIDAVKSDQVHIYREFDSYRISQFSPLMDETEKDLLRNYILTSFHHASLTSICRELSFHFACMSYLNCYNYSMTSENFLIDGKVIDCESIYNGTDLESFGFFVDLSLSGNRAQGLGADQLKDPAFLATLFNGQADTMFCNSSLHGPLHILSRFQSMYEDLFGKKLPSLKKLYWQYLSDLQEMLTGKALDKKLLKVLEKISQRPCEVSHRSGEDLTCNWKEDFRELKSFSKRSVPASVFFSSSEVDQSFVRIRFNLKRPPIKHKLLKAFNSGKRLDLYKEAMIALPMLAKDPVENSNALNFAINRSLFVLPVSLDRKGGLEFQSVKTEELKKNLSNLSPKPERDLIIRYKSLVANKLIEGECDISNLPRECIVFEVLSRHNGLTHLLRPVWVKNG